MKEKSEFKLVMLVVVLAILGFGIYGASHQQHSGPTTELRNLPLGSTSY